ncbi:Outer membrane protein beta-barrel domain-containing protein [Hymenobacter actinosclerus]|uniref:Outer membrane protein beta-barrel domain-containing protein n=1 Tax=Hymenobacter actinosclerus TaxID=82805 RepID=A0A1I0AR29_9BACT|nr:Outer membrane protein beta-barrel domain-containing protein [Hymenobacter actinosclerus]
MPKKLLLLALVSVSCAASAQTNFRPGFVLTPAGDTLRGEVDARGAIRNARLARFRAAPDAAIVEYQPRQLRGYGFVGDRLYQAETVLLADSVPRLGQPYTLPDTLARHSFLEVVVRGELSLLYLRDERSFEHYYVQLSGQPPQELVQKISFVSTSTGTAGGTAVRHKSDDYRRTLAASTQRCLAVQPAITKVSLDLNSLSRVVAQYNECVGSAIIKPAPATRRNHVQLGLVAGAETSRLTLNDNFFGRDRTLKTTSNQVSPVVGLALNFRLSGINKALSARLEAFYESQDYLARQALATPGFYQEYRVKMTSIRVPLLVRYTYPRGAIRPFAQVGYGFAQLLRNDNEGRQTRTPAVAGYQDGDWKQLVVPRKLEQGVIGSIGVSTARANQRNMAAELRYERSDGFSDSFDFGSRVNRFYLLLSYDLTK